MYTVRGIARNLLRRNKTEGLGDGSPQRGPGAGPPVGVWGKRPQKLETYTECIFYRRK